MIDLPIHVNGDGCWPDLDDKKLTEAAHMEIAALAEGMASGRPSVSVRIDLPDGSVVIAQTSLALFLAAADALKAAHGDPR